MLAAPLFALLCARADAAVLRARPVLPRVGTPAVAPVRPGLATAPRLASPPMLVRPALTPVLPAAAARAVMVPAVSVAPPHRKSGSDPDFRWALPRAAASPLRGLREFSAARERDRGASPAAASVDFSKFFDGAEDFGGAPPVAAGGKSGREDAWRDGTFLSPVDGAPIAYRARPPAGARSAPPKLFVGGMGLPDSFESYFETGRDPAADEYLLSLRGLPPTGWSKAKDTLDADARDLARMIVLAARQTDSPRVELVLHSYGSLAFQRLLQLAGEPEADAALALLRGARVVFLGGATHYGDSEIAAGEEVARMTRMVRAFVAWLDAMDSYAELVRKSAELNPLLGPQAVAYLAGWRVQRELAVAQAARPATELLLGHLREPWEPELEPIRRRILAQTRGVSREPGWQEAVIRRAADTHRLEFTEADGARSAALGIRLELLYNAGDQLVPWEVQRNLAARFGITTPEEVPPPGTVLAAEDGSARLAILPGDHYFPLKRPRELRELLLP